ncbi:Ada metal-binding domain-containing protein [Microtetraspora malaysiensis]|uniref:Ada metal-binding domain-containing protein n=1 Tax=Microtetraspora malaysiensis TaxID=161358 RepID=UPI003D8D8234
MSGHEGHYARGGPAGHGQEGRPLPPAAGGDDGTEDGTPDLPPVPADFALRILQRVGIPRERYDTYASLEIPAGLLFVAFSPETVTGSALGGAGLTAVRFEELHRARTGRSAIPARKPFPGLTTALRTGRARALPLDLGPADAPEVRVLAAVRTIPPGQLRPLSWIAQEAGLAPAGPATAGTGREQFPDGLVGILAANPFPVLVPCHRVTYENGMPCDAAYLSALGDALRAAEGIDMTEVRQWSRSGAAFLGSDTTHIYCHPTCAHARRITAPHRVPFATAREAHRAGYRACKSCRPLSV